MLLYYLNLQATDTAPTKQTKHEPGIPASRRCNLWTLKPIASPVVYRVCKENWREVNYKSSLQAHLKGLRVYVDCLLHWARICKPFKKPGIDFQPGGPARQPCLTYRTARLHRLAESISWIDSWSPWTFTNSGSVVNSEKLNWLPPSPPLRLHQLLPTLSRIMMNLGSFFDDCLSPWSLYLPWKVYDGIRRYTILWVWACTKLPNIKRGATICTIKSLQWIF